MFAADRDAGAVSEMALGAASLADFEQACFAYMKPLIGFDTACSVWSSHDGAVRHVSAIEYSDAQLLLDFPRFMGELSPGELLGFAAERPALDVNIVTPQRRARLAVYRELLDPLGVSLFVTNVWQSRFGVFGFHFARTGPLRPFCTDELGRMNQIIPSLKLGQALLASDAREIRALSAADRWIFDWRLSAREREIAALVARGFRNAEVAALLRISANTVRNHLAAIFRKAEVSTRAELVFAMMSDDPGHDPRRRSSGAKPWSAALVQRPLTQAR
jgi:DNA-binding CsgD family transcriptional regulator